MRKFLLIILAGLTFSGFSQQSAEQIMDKFYHKKLILQDGLLTVETPRNIMHDAPSVQEEAM